MKYRMFLFIGAFLFLLVGCDSLPEEDVQQKQLLIYSGITFVNPIMELAEIFEQREGVKIVISQGGSGDLYQVIKNGRIGDLYLPGDPTKRTNNLASGLFGDYVVVGYNQTAIFVAKGNPKGVRGIKDVLRKDLGVVLGNPDTSSIGLDSKRILKHYGIYRKALDNTTYITSDSRTLNRAIRRKEADLVLNWRATAFFGNVRDYVDFIDLEPEVAKKQPLQMTLLTVSKQPELARKFMALAVSPEGRAIFARYGFFPDSSSKP